MAPSPPRLTQLLRPVAGRRLPRALRARRVGHLARELPDGLRDPGFAELLARVEGGAPIHPGNAVELYCDGEEALGAMVAAIAEARREVLAEAYIFTDDGTGQRFAEALVAARQRGLDVKVLADAFGSLETRESFWDELRDGGVEVRLFHRLFPRLWWQPFRDHRKILVLDRAVAFTGGMNIADEYASFSRRRREPQPEAMRDTHLRIAGPAAAEMAGVFAEGWQRAGGAALPADGFDAPEPAGDTRALVLESRPKRGHLETAAALAATVAAARESVWLTNGYFAPGHLAVSILGRAAARGIDVRLLLPGPTDVPLVRHAGHGWFGRLLRKGVRIWEYEPAILHAKTVVADRTVAVVGSTNLDFRSFRFNAECNVVLFDGPVPGRLAAAFEDDLRRSNEILEPAWRRRGMLHRAADRLAGALAPLL